MRLAGQADWPFCGWVFALEQVVSTFCLHGHAQPRLHVDRRVQAPILALAALGCYLLVRLAYGVLTFSSYQEETERLHLVSFVQQ